MAYTFKHGDRPLDDYAIQRAVGSGGFGEVYYAISDGGREVALKYLKQNPQIELRGVSHCINLKSPHLVNIFDVRKSKDDEYFIVMEYCSGPSLRDLLIAEPEGLGSQKAAFFVREIAKGLSYLHERGVVHRDLKPGNIFYDDGYVKICDYGLSKFISVSRHSVQTSSVGTVHYMAPEIGSGNYSRGVDIYALGVILYEMLLGRVPFEGSTMGEVLMKHLTGQPEVEDLPAPFAKVIRKALEKDPNNRYQSADEMIEDLLEVEDVRESLAGFSPQSLEGAARMGGGGTFPSPMPSPNPHPGYAKDFERIADQPVERPAADPMRPLPPGVAKRVDRVSRRVEQKMVKLAGRHGSPAHEPARRPPKAPAPLAPVPVLARKDRLTRMTVPVLMSIGISLAILALGSNLGQPDDAWMGSGFMLPLTIPIGIYFSLWLVTWLGNHAQPSWTTRFTRLAVCAPLVFLGAAPMLAERRSNDEGLALAFALLAMILMMDWRKSIVKGASGELSFGRAILTAFFAMIVGSVFGALMETGGEAVGFFAAAIAGGAVLIVQMTGWWLPEASRWAMATPAGSAAPPTSPPSREASTVGIARPPEPLGEEETAYIPRPPMAYPASDQEEPAHSRLAGDPAKSTRDPRARWTATRGFWGLVSFALMSGTTILLLFAILVSDFDTGDRFAFILGCIGCAAGMTFAVRKTAATKKPSFWLESIRPFVLAALLFGVGASITGLATNQAGGDKEVWALILAALIISSLTLFTLVLFTGRSAREPASDTAEAGPIPGLEGTFSAEERAGYARRKRRESKLGRLALFAALFIALFIAVPVFMSLSPGPTGNVSLTVDPAAAGASGVVAMAPRPTWRSVGLAGLMIPLAAGTALLSLCLLIFIVRRVRSPRSFVYPPESRAAPAPAEGKPEPQDL